MNSKPDGKVDGNSRRISYMIYLQFRRGFAENPKIYVKKLRSEVFFLKCFPLIVWWCSVEKLRSHFIAMIPLVSQQSIQNLRKEAGKD